ncbi:MAG TPA: aminoglycoside phosphotransferase, partial [Candidatus Polarisedimenticolia bacterium]|nr:aminoglycoside phosphotransferase [Candidatus Polarisedimenticolia bacterium]
MSPETRALFRWSGRAMVDGAEHDWSLILKAWRRDPKTDDPAHWNYWKREFLAYSSGILDALPGISAPRLFGAAEDADVVFAWLEHIRSDLDGPWPTEQYVTAALHLGRFNGAYATDRPLPDASFLTRTYLRGWTNWIPWSD